ncbi:MAG: VWA domain-containing protein [Acidobacteriota bacterium]|nr:VWA domain-containing protein [Acidobacteriota bacterium]
MKRLPGRPGFLCLGAVLLAGSSLALPQAPAQFRIESQAVLVDVAVSDSGPVLDLRKEDFELYEAGEPTSFQLLDPTLLPVAVVFAMDVSASTVGERQRRLGEGAALFAGGLTRRDSCAVVAFSMEPFWTREFAPCGADVRTDVRAEAPGGPTSVRDSVILSLAVLHREEGRKVLLLFTDAYDNLSWTSDDLVMTAVRGSGALVYSIVARPRDSFRFLGPSDDGFRLIREVSEASGGRLLEVSSDNDLAGAYQEVLEELRTRYVLSFTPNPNLDGFVPIEVRVKRRRVDIRARPGYVAGR